MPETPTSILSYSMLQGGGEEVQFKLDHLDLTIAGIAYGPPDGIPVIGIHGWLDNAATWSGVAPYLAEDGVRFISIDLAGHGRSSHRPKGCTYHMTEYVRDVFAVADELQWQQFTLVGHSMSAAIASVCAAAFPERISRLVLVDGFGPWSQEANEGPSQLRRALSTIKVLAQKEARPYPSREDAVARLMANNPSLALHSASVLVERSTELVDESTTSACRFLHDIRLNAPSCVRYNEEQVNEYLKQIQCPVLLIIAENGNAELQSRLPRRRKSVAHLQEVQVPGGHHIHLDQPEVVIPIIRTFLQTEQQQQQ